MSEPLETPQPSRATRRAMLQHNRNNGMQKLLKPNALIGMCNVCKRPHLGPAMNRCACPPSKKTGYQGGRTELVMVRMPR